MPDYDIDNIWQRVNSELDLRKFSAARTDKERFKEFRKAVGKEKTMQNLLKIGKSNFKKLFDYGIAQKSLEGKPRVQASLGRFGEMRQKEIFAFKGKLRKDFLVEKALDKAEKKGFGVREFAPRKSRLGRPSSQLIKGEKVTVRRFKQGKREYIGVWKKGRRGFVTKLLIEE